ncbi:hypothetical protein F383_11057 [Gossypium arboreum]|uniref:Uncharacterized protein n=1 Tax=Gossypium arboreum TaxID=29729 RepID=A0A0B0PUW2_GOSAR|nr:hypothetical protein F383_11057 [Gossypium arboreum]
MFQITIPFSILIQYHPISIIVSFYLITPINTTRTQTDIQIQPTHQFGT